MGHQFHSPAGTDICDPDQRIAFHERLQARRLSVPGIAASTVAGAAPFHQRQGAS
jgi:hypothetical protein